MFDTLGIARQLIAAGINPDRANAVRRAAERGDNPDQANAVRRAAERGDNPDQANAITDAVRQAAERGDHVTTGTLDARLGALEARRYRAMLLQAGAIVGAVAAILRLPG